MNKWKKRYVKCHVNHLSLVTGKWTKSRRSKAFVEAVKTCTLHQTLLKLVSQYLLLIWLLYFAAAKGSNSKLLHKTLTLKMLVPSLVKLAHKFWKKSVLTTLLSVTQNVVTTSMKLTKISTKKHNAIFQKRLNTSHLLWWNFRNTKQEKLLNS